jgi:hypothetical protein
MNKSMIRSMLTRNCGFRHVPVVLFVVCTATGYAEPPATDNARAKPGTIKAPATPVPIREIEAEGFCLRLDLGPQALRLSVPEHKEFDDEGGRTEAPISPTLAALRTRGFVSASMLAQKAKQFDDGLYAAVELAAQQGAGSFEGKAALLRRLAEALNSRPEELSPNAPHVVLAAARLGQLKPQIPAQLEPDVRATIDRFQKNERRSKPIGFYTWSDELAAIFQHDRMLQTELKGKAGTETVIRALAADPKTQGVYESYLALVSRLTNPPAGADLRPWIAAANDGKLDAPEKDVHFFPPSKSHETDLVSRLYGDRSIPEDFDLMNEMIRRIRSGELDLQPRKESGWYDYQTWSLGSLVTPEKTREARKLVLDESYKQQLVELFKGILALTRETHIKQLEIPECGDAPLPERPIVFIAPKLTGEPLATFYARRSWSYRFVRWVLQRSFGNEALHKMHRLTPDGPVQESLHDELAAMESLFLGAHVTICRELGLPPSPEYTKHRVEQLGQDAAAFEAFSKTVATDPDLGRDARMMVPVFYDIERQKTKVWVFLGWSSRPVEIGFAKRPAVTVFDSNQKRVPEDKGPILIFETARKSIVYPVMAEVYVTKILNREEFRRHCDKYGTRKQILQNLE